MVWSKGKCDVGWNLSLLTSLVPPQSGVCRLCLIKQLNMALKAPHRKQRALSVNLLK